MLSTRRAPVPLFVLLPLRALLMTLRGVDGGGAPPADTASRWAPAATARIHPGVQMVTQGAQCTANFVYTDDAGRVYVGYSAHCAALTDEPNGCRNTSLPLGTRVAFRDGATGRTVGYGRLEFSSWLTMRRHGEDRANLCTYNDFALVRVDADYVGRVNPSVPFWGGPTALDTNGTPANARVYSYGNSSLRLGVAALGPKTGTSLGQTGGGWGNDVYVVSPGIPGDSGSGFMDSRGRAIGTLSTLTIAPLAGSNGLGDLAHELAYARRYSGIDGLRLVPGTKQFTPVL